MPWPLGRAFLAQGYVQPVCLLACIRAQAAGQRFRMPNQTYCASHLRRCVCAPVNDQSLGLKAAPLRCSPRLAAGPARYGFVRHS